jgi:hypothetical protein
VSDPIELTRAERDCAVERLRSIAADNDYGYGHGTAIDDIIGCINMVRQGDPVGTIRRHADSYAIRRKWGWLLVHTEHIEEFKGPMHQDAWPIIFSPAAS